MIQVQNRPDRLPRRPKRHHAVRDAHESLTLDLWVYATPSCLVADSATGGNASRHRERQVPFLRALATAPGSGAIGSALAGAVWHCMFHLGGPARIDLWCLSLRPARCLFSRPSSAARCQRERRYQSGKAIIALSPGRLISPTLPVAPMSRTRMMAPSDSRMRAYGCGQITLRSAAHRRLQIDALIPIGGHRVAGAIC